jgi:Fe/S biogenesis protein NfuA
MASPVTTAEPVIRITDTALATIRQLRKAEDAPDSLGLRIEVTGVRGSDFTYDLSFDPLDEADADDVVVDHDGVPVIVPAASVADLRGATLDIPTADGQAGLVLRNPNRPQTPTLGEIMELTGTVEERVQTLLDRQVNPAIASHGGFARLERVEGTTAFVTMGGGCQGCAMSALTLREGIEKAILANIPEITAVADATDHDAGANPF